MNHAALVLSFASIVAFGACNQPGANVKKDAPKATATAEAAKPATAPPATPAPAAPTKAEYKPDEAWTALAGMGPLDFHAKFGAGMTVTGTVAKVVDDPLGEYGLHFDAGGGNTVVLTFGDFGSAARNKKLAAGAVVTATKCAPTVAEGQKLALIQCELK